MRSSMRLVRIKEKAQVTIPWEICQKLNIRKGDLFEVKVVGKRIEFSPKVLTDKT